MTSGPCLSCGGGSFMPLHPIKPIGSLSNYQVSVSNYCTVCGQSLTEKCYSCNGTGKSRLLPLRTYHPPAYCAECGRSLREEGGGTECGMCGGTGKVSRAHVCIPNPF